MLHRGDLRCWLQPLALGALVTLLATLVMAGSVAWHYADNVVKVGHGVAYYLTATPVAPDRPAGGR